MINLKELEGLAKAGNTVYSSDEVLTLLEVIREQHEALEFCYTDACDIGAFMDECKIPDENQEREQTLDIERRCMKTLQSVKDKVKGLE